MSTEHNFPVGTVLSWAVNPGDDNPSLVTVTEHQSSHPDDAISVTLGSNGYDCYVLPDEIVSVVSTPEPAPAVASTVTSTLEFEPTDAREAFNLDMLFMAAEHDRDAHFRYAKGGGQVIENRTLAPHTFGVVKGNVVITGDDPDRDEPRAYRLDRIVGEVSL